MGRCLSSLEFITQKVLVSWTKLSQFLLGEVVIFSPRGISFWDSAKIDIILLFGGNENFLFESSIFSKFLVIMRLLWSSCTFWNYCGVRVKIQSITLKLVSSLTCLKSWSKSLGKKMIFLSFSKHLAPCHHICDYSFHIWEGTVGRTLLLPMQVWRIKRKSLYLLFWLESLTFGRQTLSKISTLSSNF